MRVRERESELDWNFPVDETPRCSAVNQFPFRSTEPFSVEYKKKMLMGWRCRCDHDSSFFSLFLFWHFGQLMNGSVWYGRCLGKLIRHQLRKNSHGKLFIISLTTRTHSSAKKRVRLSEKKLSSHWTSLAPVPLSFIHIHSTSTATADAARPLSHSSPACCLKSF